ncbi:MAG: OsmC family protein [Crocinitomicaceae bacterium]|nr:OsmC family protein [Crocinitomicaceae bacterium]
MISTTLNASINKDYCVKNTSRDHTWISDEPISIGGTNNGPKPTELLLSSLASCKLITLQMYAQRKGWTVEKADIQLTIVGKEEKLIVEKSVQIEGDLTDDQIKRLIDISGRCPVAKMLSNSIEIKLL